MTRPSTTLDTVVQYAAAVMPLLAIAFSVSTTMVLWEEIERLREEANAHVMTCKCTCPEPMHLGTFP